MSGIKKQRERKKVIANKLIVPGIGPVGTGKAFLAITAGLFFVKVCRQIRVL